MVEDLTADYVIVGAGSAGAPLATRLSERTNDQVLVLEAGPKNKDMGIHIPAAFSKLFRSDVDWDYLTEPQPELNNRQIYWPRGKTLGGSSSMNAMMWVRGFAADYDDWAAVAGDQWSFANVAPYFKRIENVEGASRDPGSDEGTEGALRISKQRSPRSSTGAWLEAVREAGFEVERANTPEPKGFTETMVCENRGRRWSTADGYLKPALRRRNLNVVTDAQARRVLFDGTRAVGVEYVRDGITHTVHARREVILSGGAINSPQLLMLSGIGDAAKLRELGIQVVYDAPQVGQNLLDHLVCPVGYAVESDSLFDAEKPLQLANYFLRRRGMLTSNVGEAYGFIRSRDDLALPDLELIFAPAPFFDEGLGEATEHGVVMGPILLKPLSSGEITLTSSDPLAKPRIDPRYLSDSGGVDRAAMMSGLRTCARIAEAPSMRTLLGKILRPERPSENLEETLVDALENCSHTLYHPVATCRMGIDEASVVTPDLTVRGVQGLRVVDASVMPSLIRGHTHAPSVLLGEMAADLILFPQG
ncbi:glucose-methanol-choline oxidoreductase [Mycobacterium sp. CBMA271]|uniref:GMC family oxidoreductase n=1 Tax=unclassified Mycobacteroides TaxID=2618759 RepID=UPI0012DEF411|nr:MULTISPECIES: GMC family oxidoreductase N-terminal domain-containing protein [unclassified Mycobacteroides]MUM15469.1 glucose-methanol-choline oxidoreductase [Mycobacteroides sp. CBMA 326]MUM23558.1 glucose-methanol-choline oxidoreductase [Mycobacteroides sp. CBMA 271]